ncbi:gas vesicle protein GvpJ [Kutzneria buriramensis]|uniref:Gas vesicle protein A n=1 Tax=Kutzneria buriramensis TaxID=1045776 RepID=A0A3E0HI13_9PSEU|nr:gas vesicle protein GvpJ [Kutzneria buriramensis]REH46000.1 gas vesicle protein GvpA/GvpJ/GvpM family [Kutzneria buriramensis]
MTSVIQSPGASTSLADVLNIVLDKGIVIDAFVRVSVIGIELLTIEARIVIASVDTYIRYVEAMQQLGSLPRRTAPALPAPSPVAVYPQPVVPPVETT